MRKCLFGVISHLIEIELFMTGLELANDSSNVAQNYRTCRPRDLYLLLSDKATSKILSEKNGEDISWKIQFTKQFEIVLSTIDTNTTAGIFAFSDCYIMQAHFLDYKPLQHCNKMEE